MDASRLPATRITPVIAHISSSVPEQRWPSGSLVWSLRSAPARIWIKRSYQWWTARAPLHILVLLAVFKLYSVLNLFSEGKAACAYFHAGEIVGIGRRFGIFVEPQAQRMVLHGEVGGISAWSVLVNIYGHAHITWLATMLLWLYLFRRERFGYCAGMMPSHRQRTGSRSHAVTPRCR